MKKLLIAIAVFTSFMVGYGVVGSAWPGVANRSENRGYFDNDFDNSGTYVFPQDYVNGGHREALPARINTASEFIAFIEDKLRNGNRQEKTGAAFIIQTMIGGAQDRTPSAAAINEWKARVNYAQANGLINWRKNNHPYTVNSYYQGTNGGSNPNDDAFYYERDDADAIVFYDKNNRSNILYAIKWECANPLGTLRALNEAGPDFDITGSSRVDNANPKAGDTIHFTHFIGNNGPDASAGPVRWSTRNALTGQTIRPLQSMGVVQRRGQAEVVAARETFTIPSNTPAGTRICREIGWTPDTPTSNAQWGADVCATVRFDYTLVPSVTVRINNGTTEGTVAEPGDDIRFEYNINNTGTTQSNDTACTTNGNTFPGYVNVPGAMVNVNDQPITCGTIQPGYHQVGYKDLKATADTTICRSLTVSPASPTVPSTTSDTVCVVVATKPYVKVFGGDVSVGGGLAEGDKLTDCTPNEQAGIIGWNKRDVNGAGWSGAGVQYAAMAMYVISDFATSQPLGGAPAPSGLAFSNSDVSDADRASGLFGKSMAGISCTPNYYDNTLATAQRASVSPFAGNDIDFNSNATGNLIYKTNESTSTDVKLHASTIKKNQKIVLYVNGDLHIDGPIIYEDGWSITSAPMLMVVVRGNIYIAPNVGRLDGTFIAQATEEEEHTGEIHTCSDVGDPFNPMTINGGLLDTCRNKLVVNGAMVADRILLLRTLATLRDSSVGETLASNNAAEVFNYSPAAWIPQPSLPGAAGDEYDSITSLPPIL